MMFFLGLALSSPFLASSFLIPSTSTKQNFVASKARSISFLRALHHSPFLPLFASENEENDDSPEIVFATDPNEVKIPELTSRDFELVNQLYEYHINEQLLEAQIMMALPQISPQLVVALRNAASSTSESPYDEEQQQKMNVVGKVLEHIMENKLESGKDLLAKLLDCGEIRKLDSEIGKAARQGSLDMAFFTVMNMNLADAQRAKESPESKEEAKEGLADRYQILTHIYTRCQEEVEKSVPPGAALLNKLLRTDMPTVRANQLKHFLGPQKPQKIITPDGREVTLQPQSKDGTQSGPLVPPSEFIDAITQTVTQIRKVEQAGGMSRSSAANMVEACRQVAIEARLAIVELYGEESEEVELFQDGLQPVFRPGSG